MMYTIEKVLSYNCDGTNVRGAVVRVLYTPPLALKMFGARARICEARGGYMWYWYPSGRRVDGHTERWLDTKIREYHANRTTTKLPVVAHEPA